MKIFYFLTKQIIASFFVITLLLNSASPSFALAFDNKDYNNNLQIINKEGDEILGNFKVKIAKDKASLEEGLMFVENLPNEYGLLFDFSVDKIIYMWMKNTLVSLDMIFIDKDDVVAYVVHSAIPLSTNTISSRVEARKVLEVVAGTAKKLEIKTGDKIKLY